MQHLRRDLNGSKYSRGISETTSQTTFREKNYWAVNSYYSELEDTIHGQ